MKLDYKLSRIIVLSIAVIMILIGIGQAKLGWKIDQNVSTILLVIAAAVFFIGRRPNNTAQSTENESTNIEKETDDKTSEAKIDNSENEKDDKE